MLVPLAVAVLVVVPVGWVLLAMARWSAPVSAAVGLLILWGAAYLDWDRGMAYGGGLFLFSTLLFVVGGGLRGR